MPIDAAKAVAAKPRTGEIAWNSKDVQLYHLGVGAGTPATDPDELRYTLESRLHVLPSFATVAGNGSPGVISGLSMPGIEVDLAKVLHGGQSLTIHRPSPSRAPPPPPAGSPPSTTRARPPSSSCAPKSPTPTARCGPTTRRSSYGGGWVGW